MSTWELRGRALLERQFAVVVVVLVVLALVGGWVTYTAHVSPGTTTEQRTVGTWQPSGEFDHSATVTRENPLYDRGTEFSNRNAYLGGASPILNGTYVFGYHASDGGELRTTVDLTLVVRSVEVVRGENGDERWVRLWELNRTFAENRTKRLSPREALRIPFSFNATRLHNETTQISEQLASRGTTEAFVRADIELEGTVNGRAVEESLNQTLPLALGADVYRVDPATTLSGEYETTEAVAVQQEVGPLQRLGGPALLVVSLAGLGALVTAQSRNRLGLTDAEREWLAYREDRSEFDEWITRFEIPPAALDGPRAESESLADLVDFAIDVDGGVVEAPDGREYYVLTDQLLYTYTSPPAPGDGSVDDVGGDGTGDDPSDGVGERLKALSLGLGDDAAAESEKGTNTSDATNGTDERLDGKTGDESRPAVRETDGSAGPDAEVSTYTDHEEE